MIFNLLIISVQRFAYLESGHLTSNAQEQTNWEKTKTYQTYSVNTNPGLLQCPSHVMSMILVKVLTAYIILHSFFFFFFYYLLYFFLFFLFFFFFFLLLLLLLLLPFFFQFFFSFSSSSSSNYIHTYNCQKLPPDSN